MAHSINAKGEESNLERVESELHLEESEINCASITLVPFSLNLPICPKIARDMIPEASKGLF